MDSKVIASINLKGGVAKTTTTVGLAQILAGSYGKKVLVIDLDPQTNATTILTGEDKWLELDNSGFTLATLFSDAINGTENFDLDNTLQKSVGNIKDMSTLDLLPSNLRLIDLQDKLITTGFPMKSVPRKPPASFRSALYPQKSTYRLRSISER